MKLNYTIFLIFLASLFTSALAGQSELIIEPGQGFLNQLIFADTTATGERADSNRVYVLRRGGDYFIQGPFRTQTFKLHIKAEDGEGSLPHVMAFPDLEGSINSNLFRTYDDAVFENLHLDGESNTMDQPYPARIIRMEGEGSNLTVRGCILTNGAQSGVRVNRAAGAIIFENTVVANMGAIAQDNMGNGRVIDCRGSAVDFLKLENCTFVNSMDRIIRHRGGSGVLDSFEMNHCTAINHMGYHGVFELGNIGRHVKITNNLFYDVLSMGADSTDAERLTEFDATMEVDALGNPRIVWVSTIPNDSTTFEIDQNIYSISDELQAWFDEYNLDEGPNHLITNHISGKLEGDDVPFEKVQVALGNVPPFAKELQDWYWRPEDEGGAGKMKVTTGEFSMNRETSDYFGYNATLDGAFNVEDGSLYGQNLVPVGDRNWMSTITNTNDPATSQIPMRSLPNPFSQHALLEYSLETTAQVSLDWFDVTGRRLRHSDLGLLTAGVHSTPLRARDLLPGMYFLRISSNGHTGILRVTIQ